jgi:hypothetical protein
MEAGVTFFPSHGYTFLGHGFMNAAQAIQGGAGDERPRSGKNTCH